MLSANLSGVTFLSPLPANMRLKALGFCEDFIKQFGWAQCKLAKERKTWVLKADHQVQYQ